MTDVPPLAVLACCHVQDKKRAFVEDYLQWRIDPHVVLQRAFVAAGQCMLD